VDDLLRAVDPVPVAGDRFEAVVDREILTVRQLELLQDRGHVPAGENVARQQQNRQPVDRGTGRGGEHIRRSRTDRGGAGESLQPVLHLRKGCRRMDHSLFVARQVIPELRVLLQRLADPGHVPVSEDPEAAGEERASGPVTLDELVRQKPDHGLRHGEADRLHQKPPLSAMNCRASSS
jgi:hypothetical protein